MNYYEFLERPAARLLHRLPRPVVSRALALAGRSGLLSDADFLPEVIEEAKVARGPAARRMAGDIFTGLGHYFSDIGTLMHGSDRQIKAAFEGRVRVDRPERWRALENGRFMVFGAHFACFYLTAFATEFFNSVTIIRRYHSPGRDALLDRLCAITGKDIEVLGLTDPRIGMDVVRRLKSGRPVCGMMDFFYSDVSMFITPFMGRDCATPAGLPLIAAKLDLPLLPVFVLREDDGSYLIKVGEPLRRRNDLGELEAGLDMACRMNACIEDAIRATPSQWTFWPTLPARWAYTNFVAQAEAVGVEP
jgi:lauroyl/myristoyl acyltransferase